MGQVIVEIGGRSYSLACRDGDEAHLAGLATEIAEKAEGLTRSLGPMSEPRLLLMAALVVADELYDLRINKVPSWILPRDGAAVETAAAIPNAADNGSAAEQTARLVRLLERAENLADRVAVPADDQRYRSNGG